MCPQLIHASDVVNLPYDVQLKHTIRALAVKGDLTFAATGCDIVESRRVHKCAQCHLLLEGRLGVAVLCSLKDCHHDYEEL